MTLPGRLVTGISQVAAGCAVSFVSHSSTDGLAGTYYAKCVSAEETEGSQRARGRQLPVARISCDYTYEG